MAKDTAELPADPDLKKLAHDVVADENEYAVPMLIDFYKVLAELDAEDHASRSDFRINDPESDVPPEKWRDIINALARDGPIAKHSGASDTYTFEAAGNDEWDIERRVLNTLIAQTNEFQGEWTSERSLLTLCAANGRLTEDETLSALVALTDDGLVDEDGEEYRPAENVERVPHPGEVSKDFC